MKIDAVMGVISFPGITIGPHMLRHEFLQTSLGATARVGVVNQGWVTLHVDLEPGVHGSLIFKDDQLVQVIATMDLASGEKEEWSESSEIKRKSQHDAWLKLELGNPPYRYLWGSVGSEFDSKSCSSDIVITFGTFPEQKDWRNKKEQSA